VCTSLILFLIWGAVIMSVCVIDFGRATQIARAAWKQDPPPV
jgi:hypothetical protein